MIIKSLLLLLIIIVVVKVTIFAQNQDTLMFTDSIVVYGNLSTKSGVEINSIDFAKLSNLSTVNYDPLSALSIIGASYQSDFNVVPLLEGADFQEQDFVIENIPAAFPVNLLGFQSGLNSLLFSNITLQREQLSRNFGKPITLNAGIRKQDNNTSFVSKISNLKTENLLSIPFTEISGKLTLGYNRSLFESMIPIYDMIVGNNDFQFQSFPFYEGFQSVATLDFNHLKFTQLLMYNNDKGKARINTKDFDFGSNSLSVGSKLNFDYDNLESTITFYYLKGRNNIDYSFNENSKRIVGDAYLDNINTGIDIYTKIIVGENENINISAGYKYDEGKSTNESNYRYSGNKITANYSINNYELALGYQRFLLKNIFFNIHSGMTYSFPRKVGFLSQLDFMLSLEQDFNINLMLGYKSNYTPDNSIFYTFQNSILDPVSTNTLYFIDRSDLPIKPLSYLDLSLYISKKFENKIFVSDLQLKFFYRALDNLLFSNTYPLEATYYNTDFSFNQDYEARKYGIKLIITQFLPSLFLKNIIGISLIKSININSNKNLSHNALNYNPFTVTNVIDWQFGDFNLSSFMIFKIGRYIFSKSLDKYYSYLDSSYAYSLKTNLEEQKNLNSQFRTDLALKYLVIKGQFNLDIGLTIINIFNSEFESNRLFEIDSEAQSVREKSEFINLPRFFIVTFNAKYQF